GGVIRERRPLHAAGQVDSIKRVIRTSTASHHAETILAWRAHDRAEPEDRRHSARARTAPAARGHLTVACGAFWVHARVVLTAARLRAVAEFGGALCPGTEGAEAPTTSCGGPNAQRAELTYEPGSSRS